VKILWAVPVTNPLLVEEKEEEAFGCEGYAYRHSTLFDNFFCLNYVRKSEGLNPKMMTNQVCAYNKFIKQKARYKGKKVNYETNKRITTAFTYI